MREGLVVGSLFAGIGGFDLAARWMGWRTAWFSEVDPYASRVLAHHWPGVPNHGDIRAMDFTQVEPVDMLCGGFPCQPHSVAGKKKGSEDERDLWPEYERAIRLLRPRFVVAENVPGLFASDGGRFFGRVLGALAALGYDAEWTVLSGADVGAPQERQRIWLVAHAERDGGATRVSGPHAGHEGVAGIPDDDGGQLVHAAGARRGAGRPGTSGPVRDDAWGPELKRRSGEMGDADNERRHGGECIRAGWRVESPDPSRGLWDDAVPVQGYDGTVRCVPREAAQAGPESPLWPVADGVPDRVARLRCVGNAVVPQCAFVIFQRIAAVMARAAAPERVA